MDRTELSIQQLEEILNQDFEEVESETPYFTFQLGKKYSKMKNYKQVCQQLEGNLQNAYLIPNTHENQQFFDCQQLQDQAVLLDGANNIMEIEEEPIIGTSIIIQKPHLKENKSKTVCISSAKNNINANPHNYTFHQVGQKLESQEQPQVLQQFYKMLDQKVNIKNKKKTQN